MLFEQLFHNLLEDQEAGFINSLDHVEVSGELPDKKELDPRLLRDVPGQLEGVQGLGRDGPTVLLKGG